jgi:hypothetical protein
MKTKPKTKTVDNATMEAIHQDWKAGQPSILVKKSEAARMLGFGIRWLDGHLNNGAPCVRVGRSVRLRRSDVEAFARDGKWPEKKGNGKP